MGGSFEAISIGEGRGPSGVPEITDETVAMADPELAVLSAMAHGKDADTAKVVSIANAAQQASRRLDADRSRLYVDLIHLSISEAARRALHAVDMSKYQYQSDFAKQYIALGKSEGIEIGRAALSGQEKIQFGYVGIPKIENIRRSGRAT